MKWGARTLLAAGLVAAAGTVAYGLGFNGTFDNLAASIADDVSAGDPTAEKIQNFIEKESDKLSKDFVTFAKVVKAAEKNDFMVVSEEDLETLFNEMILRSVNDGLAGFQGLLEAANNDPVKAAKLLKQNARYLAKQGKILAKYGDVWGNPEDPAKVDLAKAAIFYSQLQKMYELLMKKFPLAG